MYLWSDNGYIQNVPLSDISLTIGKRTIRPFSSLVFIIVPTLASYPAIIL